MSARITVIVLSYNNTADTLACLDSLQPGQNETFDVLVVDNASTDGAPAAIRARHPGVTLIELAENSGWAGGNNAGIAQALGQDAGLICLLNNDTIIPAGAITALARAAGRHAPCLMHPAIDYADPLEGAQLDPARSVPPGRYTPLGQDGDIFELDFAYGACLMVPAEVFCRIGMFDERFFLQLEETDFHLRARRAGIRSLCAASIRIRHAESRSFGGRTTPLKTYYIVRNTLLLAEKHHRNPARALPQLRSIYWHVANVSRQHSAGKAPVPPLLWPVSRNPFLAAARAGLRDYLLRRFGRISPSSLRAITSIIDHRPVS